MSTFTLIRTDITRWTATLGDTNGIRKALSECFTDFLWRTTAERLKLGLYERPHWTLATDEDVIEALARLSRYLTYHTVNRTWTHAVPWSGGVLRSDGREVFLTPADNADSGLSMAAVFHTAHTQNPWNVYLTDNGKHVCSPDHYITGPTSIHAKSSAGAAASLLKLVERHFKVKFEELSHG